METCPNFVSGKGKVKYRFTGSDCVITVALLLSNDGLNERVSILRIVCWIVPGIDIQLPEIKGERDRDRERELLMEIQLQFSIALENIPEAPNKISISSCAGFV